MVRHRSIALISLFAAVCTAATALAEGPPDAARVAELAKLLPPEPRGVGRPIDDREAWKRLADSPAFGGVVREAEQFIKEPIPDLTDELYLDFSRTGNRSRAQRVIFARRSRLATLVLAECLEDRGRFLAPIEATIGAICDEKAWTLPAHDRDLANFEGKAVEIDLSAAATAWNLATTDYWFGGKLSEATRRRIADELERRTFTPFEQMVREGKPRMWWLVGTNNWNAVCLAGVTGAGLTSIGPAERRAFFAASAERYIEYFRSGFTPDGYCSEGVGYWNYGFGHYVLLSETLVQATGGKLDLMADPRVAAIAMYGRRIEFAPGICPAFSDCSVSAQPDTAIMAYLSRRFGWGLGEIEQRGLGPATGPSRDLFEVGLYGFENSASRRLAAGESSPPEKRDWFAEAGIYTASIGD